MHAVKGLGKDHAKFSPVGMLRYTCVKSDLRFSEVVFFRSNVTGDELLLNFGAKFQR